VTLQDVSPSRSVPKGHSEFTLDFGTELMHSVFPEGSKQKCQGQKQKSKGCGLQQIDFLLSE